MTHNSRSFQRRRRHRRHTVRGTAARPRLVVFRSHRHIYCQLIDDERGHTLCSSSTQQLRLAQPGTTKAATQVGLTMAQHIQHQKVRRIFFDRSGYLYHGRVKALAEAVRQAGVQF